MYVQMKILNRTVILLFSTIIITRVVALLVFQLTFKKNTLIMSRKFRNMIKQLMF